MLRVRTTELEELVTARTQDLEEQHYEAFERLATIAEYRDPDSGEHSSRVGELAAELALQLNEDRSWAEELRLAGRLHDVGKVGVPDAILQKPGALTDEEFEIMKTHTTVGAHGLRRKQVDADPARRGGCDLPPRALGRQRLSLRISRDSDPAQWTDCRRRRCVRRTGHRPPLQARVDVAGRC